MIKEVHLIRSALPGSRHHAIKLVCEQRARGATPRKQQRANTGFALSPFSACMHGHVRCRGTGCLVLVMCMRYQWRSINFGDRAFGRFEIVPKGGCVANPITPQRFLVKWIVFRQLSKTWIKNMSLPLKLLDPWSAANQEHQEQHGMIPLKQWKYFLRYAEKKEIQPWFWIMHTH